MSDEKSGGPVKTEMVGFPVKKQGLVHEDLKEIFTYHAPDEEQLEAYERVRSAALDFAATIVSWVPASADQTAAIRLVRQAVMTANAGIALRGKY